MATAHLRRLRRAALTLTLAAGGANAATLESVVADLAGQGESILYSTDLIDPETPVDLGPAAGAPDLAALLRWLEQRALTLQPVAGGWVVARAQPAQDTPPDPDTDPADEPGPPLENVIVTGTRHHLAQGARTGSATTLWAEDLYSVPTLASDAMRAAGQLPGMASMGVSAKPYVRGGVQDELLIRLNGVELLDAYHLVDFQNLFSVVDDRSVDAVDVYTGGFPARYGNRMSGVMDISSNRPEQPARVELGLSLFSLQANVQGTAHDGATDYLASARRGNLDLVLDRTDPDLGRPRYYDALATVSHRPDDDQQLSFGLFLTSDDVRLTEDETVAESQVDSRYFWGRLDWRHSNTLSSSHALAYTGSNRRKGQFDLDDDSGAGGFLDHSVDLWKLRASSDAHYLGPRWRMEFGGHVEFARAHYDSAALIDRGLLGQILDGSAIDQHDIHEDPDGWSGSLYWGGELALTDRLTIQPGLRWDTQGFDPEGANDHLSPRLGVRYRPAAGVTLRLDAGRYRQPQEIQELQAADGVSRYTQPQSADHFIAGIHWQTNSGWEFQGDLYRKHYHETRLRFENVYNPFVLIPEIEPDRVRLEPDRARARGVDAEVRYRWSDPASLTLRYGYLDAEDRIDGQWLPRRWSQRHTATAIAQWQGPRTTASIAVTWHSGWRGAAVPESLPAGATLDITDVLSGAELDDYLSIDIGLRRTWTLRRLTVTGFAGVTNLTDRDNVAGIEYDPEQEDGEITFDESVEYVLPRIPSIGVLIAF